MFDHNWAPLLFKIDWNDPSFAPTLIKQAAMIAVCRNKQIIKLLVLLNCFPFIFWELRQHYCSEIKEIKFRLLNGSLHHHWSIQALLHSNQIEPTLYNKGHFQSDFPIESNKQKIFSLQNCKESVFPIIVTPSTVLTLNVSNSFHILSKSSMIVCR